MWMQRSNEAVPRWRAPYAVGAALVPIVSFVLAAVVACGGGVDSGGTGATPGTVTVGSVSGFGSIVVAGIHHDESMAQIVDDDGQPLGAEALQLGTSTVIEGSTVVDTGTRRESTARRVRVVERLVGRLDGVDAGALGLTVLGQHVVVTPGTVFDARLAGGLAALPVGTVLGIFGQLDVAGGRIVATRIELRPQASVFVLHAVVSRYDRAARRLTLGGVEVDLARLAEAELPSVLPVGTVARVKLNPQRITALWQATALRAATLMLPDGDEVEIEGRITQFASAEDFSIDGIPVDARAATFPDGRAGLAAGARVEVQGRATGGKLIARTVKLESDDEKPAGSFEVEGRISAIDTAAFTFVVRGITVSYAGAPRFEGGTAADLALNRRLEVRGTLSADRTRLQAISIHIEL